MDGVEIKSPVVSDDASWGARLLACLATVKSEFILMTFDDFLIESPVDVSRLQSALDIMNNKKFIDVIYLARLENELLDNKPQSSLESFVPVKIGVAYSLNSRPALWRRSALIRYTGTNDTPWAWEYFGSFRMTRKNSYAMSVNPYCSEIYSNKLDLGGALH